MARNGWQTFRSRNRRWSLVSSARRVDLWSLQHQRYDVRAPMSIVRGKRGEEKLSGARPASPVLIAFGNRTTAASRFSRGSVHDS